MNLNHESRDQRRPCDEPPPWLPLFPPAWEPPLLCELPPPEEWLGAEEWLGGEYDRDGADGPAVPRGGAE